MFRMLAERNVPYEHVKDSKKMNLVLVGDECASRTSTNLAPPCIVDGEVVISQNIPVHIYVGKKLGFDEGIDCEPEIALQYMCDLDDLHKEMDKAASLGREKNDVIALRAYLEGARFNKHIESIERSIKGPFYFGEEPTYVDFIATGYFDMMDGKWLDSLKPYSGDVLARTPKLKGVVSNIRTLPSSANIPKLPVVPPSFVITNERASTWSADSARL